MYGDKDRIIPRDVQDTYQEVLNDGNPQNEFITLEGGVHNFLRPHTPSEAKIRGRAITHVARFSVAHFNSGNDNV
jgi:hypothetical protein